MAMLRSEHQPDLFDSQRAGDEGSYAARLQEPPPAYFIERIRNELTATLARARGALRISWKDLTAATLAELRFKLITHWLPDAEAQALRDSFAREMARLWVVAETEAEDAP